MSEVECPTADEIEDAVRRRTKEREARAWMFEDYRRHRLGLRPKVHSMAVLKDFERKSAEAYLDGTMPWALAERFRDEVAGWPAVLKRAERRMGR